MAFPFLVGSAAKPKSDAVVSVRVDVPTIAARPGVAIPIARSEARRDACRALGQRCDKTAALTCPARDCQNKES